MKLKSFFASLGLEVDSASFASGIAAVDGVRFVLAALKHVAHEASEAFIGFNASVESMKSRLTTVAQMNLKIPFQQAKVAADNLFDGLQEDALKTPATTRELTDFAATIAGVVLKAGKSMNDLRDITAGTVVLGKQQQMGPYAAIQTQEALMGVVRVNQRFSRFMIEQAMGSTLEKFKALSPQKKIEEWIKALKSPAVKDALKEYEHNWAGVTSSITDIKEIVLGAIGKPLFEELKRRLFDFKNWLLEHRKEIEEFGGKLMKVFLAFIHSIERIGKLAAKEFDAFAKKLQAAGIHVSGLDVALGALVTVLTLATAAAVALGVRMAISFAIAAAPVLVLGALLAIAYLIIEDIIVGLQGGHSVLRDLYHEWKDFLKDWSQPAPGDSWITTWLKDWARLISDVHMSWRLFKQDFTTFGPLQSYLETQKGFKAYGPNGKLNADEALEFYAQHPTKMRSDAPASGPFRDSYSFGDTSVTVVATPGADPQELGKVIGKTLQDFWDAKMRRAAPGVAQ